MDGCNAQRIPHMAIFSSLGGLANMPGGYFWGRTKQRPRQGGCSEKRDQGQYKGRSPKAPPEVLEELR
jgi:hypothetical protein